jgi:hypothetical protein
MKSRRRMAFPELGTTLYLGFKLWPSKQKFATSDIGRNGEFACENPELPSVIPAMSAQCLLWPTLRTKKRPADL